MKLTKIEVAEAHLKTAVRLMFAGEHLAPIHLLAGSAREILTTIGEKIGVRTTLKGLSESTGKSLKEFSAAAHENFNFLKRADRDADATVTLDLEAIEHVLFIACHDFGRVAKGQPIELQVYEAWWLAKYFERVSEAPLRQQEMIRCIRRFPGIRSASRENRLRLGREALEKVEHDPSFRMDYVREIALPGTKP